jgi:ankyrin repeat protein
VKALAIVLMLTALALHGQESTETAVRRGDRALDAKKPDEAIAAYRKCLELIPRYRNCAYSLALAYALKGEAAASVEWLGHAADRGFDDIEIILKEERLASAREHPGFAAVAETIQRRLPPDKPRPWAAPENHERGMELVAMVRGDLGSGAAILLGRDGDRVYLATANHVVRQGGEEATKIEVQLKPLAPRWLPAQLLPPAGDPELDLALLTVDAASFDFCALPLHLGGDSTRLRRGDPVYPVGYPGGILWAMPLAPDHASQVFPNQISFESQFVRIGFSGGALLNRRGEVVGMIVADEPPLGRAVPLALVLNAARAAGAPIQLSASGKGALHAAAKRGDAAAVEALLRDCADPNAVDAAGRTPLHEAAAQGSADAVRLLLRAGARRHAWTVIREGEEEREWGTPLHFAAARGSADAVKALVENTDADLETLVRDAEGRLERADAALHIAAKHNRAEVAAALVDAGADIEMHGWEGMTPLGTAAHYGSVATARMLLQRGAAHIPAGDSRNTPALTTAAASGQVKMLEILVEHGADVNRTDASWQIATALHAAAAGGHVEAARYLISQKAVVDAPGYEKATPLHTAAKEGTAAIVELLLASGADVNSRDASNYTALQKAAGRKDNAVLRALVKGGAEIGYVLHEVLEHENVEAARMLIENGADLSLKNESGAQPLHIAVYEGLTEAVALLLKAGAPPEAVDTDGDTPLHLAVRHLPIVELLLAAKAPVNARSKSGATPLYNAVVAGQAAAVTRLLQAGADPKLDAATSTEGNTLVAHVAAQGTAEILELLLAAGANPNRGSEGGVAGGPSPLTLAAGRKKEAEKMVALLLKAGARVITDDERSTPLHAALAGDPEAAPRVLRLLLSAGAPVDAKNENGRTPLHEAADRRNVEAVRVLLAAGAKVNATDTCEATPLWSALPGQRHSEANALAVVELLVAAGADVNAPSKCTPGTLVDLAERQGYLRVRQLLLSKGAKPAS